MSEYIKLKTYTPQQALIKAQRYCAYQERCHQEVRNKLYSFGLKKSDVENVIVSLIDSNFINEERFALLFAGGKLRINHWGKMKIELELKARKISPYCIKKALNSITNDEYLSVIEKLIFKREKSIKTTNDFERKSLIGRYLIGRGFESELVWDVLNL